MELGWNEYRKTVWNLTSKLSCETGEQVKDQLFFVLKNISFAFPIHSSMEENNIQYQEENFHIKFI